MKVLGIGNAIVDVICKVKESFLSENNLTKSTMKLVDETEFKKLLSNLNIKETIPTGTCLILITPDSERTMCTFLGIAGKISDKDIDENVVDRKSVV